MIFMRTAKAIQKQFPTTAISLNKQKPNTVTGAKLKMNVLNMHLLQTKSTVSGVEKQNENELTFVGQGEN